MKLGQLIEALNRLNSDLPINGQGLDSYRGYYDELAVEPGWSVVGELQNEACSALDKVFTGYKGGEFEMTDETPLWYAFRGESTGRAVVGLARIFRPSDGREEIRFITHDTYADF